MVQARRPRPHGRLLAIGLLGSSVAIVPFTVMDQSERAVLSDYALGAPPAHHWRLPRRLSEISGLAMTADDRLFAHDDERAVIYEINYADGGLIKAFAMGDRTAVGDFEGIAIVDDTFYLVTSDGRLFETTEGADGDRMLYNTYGTGVGRACEVEGLAFEPADRSLLLLCKTPRTKESEAWMTIYRWSIDRRALAQDSVLRIPIQAILTQIGTDEFRPSGIERHQASGHYVIIAARQRAIVEISENGSVLGFHRFRGRDPDQIEGITFSSGGDLFLATESGGRGRGELAVYSVSTN